MIGADISFGYFNRLPLRKKDKENLEKRNKMQGIFGKITGKNMGTPKSEGGSDSDEESK